MLRCSTHVQIQQVRHVIIIIVKIFLANVRVQVHGKGLSNIAIATAVAPRKGLESSLLGMPCAFTCELYARANRRSWHRACTMESSAYIRSYVVRACTIGWYSTYYGGSAPA